MAPIFFLNKDHFREDVNRSSTWLQGTGASADPQYHAIRHLILDCSAVSFIDSAGANAIVEVRGPDALLPGARVSLSSLLQLTQELREKGVSVIIVSTDPVALRMLADVGGSSEKTVEPLNTCSSLLQAVDQCLRHQQLETLPMPPS